MGKILTIPFGSGKTELAATDIQQLKTELEKPEDRKAARRSRRPSSSSSATPTRRATRRRTSPSPRRAPTPCCKTMRDKCGVINVMHTVGMGGSKLLDAQNLEKNRIVEIWAVLP